MVSSKVYINSGPFSFFFEHGPGDSGLGMITPVYCEHEEILEEPLTRITLTLLDKLDREDLKNQFRDLPGTILLFLEKLKRITINEYDAVGTLSESVTYNRNSSNSEHGTTTLERGFTQMESHRGLNGCGTISRRSSSVICQAKIKVTTTQRR
jgi:hypothetical protein